MKQIVNGNRGVNIEKYFDGGSGKQSRRRHTRSRRRN
jgi:hypothetical protein